MRSSLILPDLYSSEYAPALFLMPWRWYNESSKMTRSRVKGVVRREDDTEMFTPAWKKEDPDSVQKALKKLPFAGTGKLKKIALEAPSEEVAVAAVVQLGAGTPASVKDALSEIYSQSSSEHIKSVVWLQQIFSGSTPPDKGWHNPSDAVHRCLSYDHSLTVHDVAATLDHVSDPVRLALLARAPFMYSDWKTFFGEELENMFHRTLRDLFDKGIGLSIFLEDMRQDGQEKLFSREESRRLKEIYDGDAGTDFYFDFHDPYHPSRYKVYTCLVKIWALYGDEISGQLVKLKPVFRAADQGDLDYRSAKARQVEEDTRALLDSLKLDAFDIPDEVLLKAKQFGFPLPLQYLYQNGKKEFVEMNFRRTKVRTTKSFDPEDDRYYTEEETIVFYGDPEDGDKEGK